MRCTVYAQISRFKLKAKVSLMSPQWGKCSKDPIISPSTRDFVFQSPQWGKCSKGKIRNSNKFLLQSFSPRNGESVLKIPISNVPSWRVIVSVPAMGKVF